MLSTGHSTLQDQLVDIQKHQAPASATIQQLDSTMHAWAFHTHESIPTVQHEHTTVDYFVCMVSSLIRTYYLESKERDFHSQRKNVYTERRNKQLPFHARESA